MPEPFRAPFKATLLSAHTDSPEPIGKLKAFFCEYQYLVLEVLKQLEIDYTHHEDLAKGLHGKLVLACDDLIELITFVEFILSLIANNTFVDGNIPFFVRSPEEPHRLSESLTQIIRDLPGNSPSEETRGRHQPLRQAVEQENELSDTSHEGITIQRLHETITVQRLESQHLLECRLSSRKTETYMTDLRGVLRRFCNILHNIDPTVAVAMWKVQAGSSHNPYSREIRFREYPQNKVSENDLSPDGKYRAICKIIVTFQNGQVGEATAFLVNDNTAATAAHNLLYECSTSIGICDNYATSIEVCIGYRGRSHVQGEVRWGKHVAINWGYYLTRNRTCDFAVIRIDKPFEKVDKYIPYGSDSERPDIAVVGYPGDIPEHEKGQHMYKSEGSRIDVQKDMLRYKLDTACGNSGSPVLEFQEDGSSRAIGVHNGGTQRECNFAARINHMGNDIPAFERSLDIWGTGHELSVYSFGKLSLWKISP